MNELKVETYTTYIAEYDRTIVWQDMYLGDLSLQTIILGWYYGEPNDDDTRQYSLSTTVAQYF